MWWLLRLVAAVLALQTLVTADCPGVVSRKDWDALQPTHVKYVSRPVNIVIIQATLSRNCSTDTSCEKLMQETQTYAMDKLHFWDLSSSFYVGGNGKIYEGTGWLHAGSHTYGFNSRSIGISFVGFYEHVEPTASQVAAVKALLRCGVEEEHLAPDYKVVAHKQLVNTLGPGRNLYRIIRMWPEWLEDVGSIKIWN